ncbi:MAG: ABC transporter related protein [Candidatus Cloacimonadota bacterium]|nr:MAG: ABC transporter related protein [Candidatus Cloacimonadota bacterium]PIE81640.1 MAG: ABC transporter related protein [Candidatus Delongbacteria bacterium]
MIRTENLTFKYDKKPIINRLNLSIDMGECVGIKGRSGSGKTTLLRLIAGLEETKSGKIFINNIDVSKLPAYKRNVGFIFQNFALFPHLSVKKNILFGVKHLNKSEKEEKMMEMTKLFEIDDYLDRYPSELSQGQRQRVAVSRALICEPDILLFDEPFSALDSDIKEKMRLEIKNILQRVKITSLIVSHDDEDLNTICNRVINI